MFWGEALWAEVGPLAEAAGRLGLRLHGQAVPRRPEAGGARPGLRSAGRGLRDLAHGRGAQINRFQRLTGDIVQPFDDAGPSIPVPFISAQWGSLASFGAKALSERPSATTGRAGTASWRWWSSGDRVKAMAVSAGGESGDPASRHFNDQALRYSQGDLREVYFYPEQLKGHVERTYRPGDSS